MSSRLRLQVGPRGGAVRAAALRVVVVLAVLTGGAGPLPAAAGAPPTASGAAHDVVPAAFSEVMGYEPVAAPGRPGVLVRPDGDCSTPTGGTAFGFDDACREHDLAYDVLEYRAAVDGVADPRLRWAADLRFGLRLVQRCGEVGGFAVPCLATAAVYATAVTLNSVRQGYGLPVAESDAQVAASTAAMVAAGLLLLVPRTASRWFRRVLRRAELDLVPPPGGSGWSGAPGSLVRWADLGREGRRLLTRAPVAPGALRVVVGLESSRGLRARVDLALAEAERVGAFTRGTVCVAVPTGCGWLNPAAVEGLERATEGDVATISVPYAAAPSWLVAVAHPGAHRRAALALLEAVHARWLALDPAQRPRLVVLGESLGANGMAAALDARPDITADLAGGLLVGGLRSAWWPERGRVSLVGHDDDPVVRLGLRTLHRLPGAGSAPAGSGHHYGSELGAAWVENLGGRSEAPPTSGRSDSAQPSVPFTGPVRRVRGAGGSASRGRGRVGGLPARP